MNTYKNTRTIETYDYEYNPYYFTNVSKVKVRPIKKLKKQQKNSTVGLRKLITLIFFSLLLFCVLPYSFNSYIANIFTEKSKNYLNVDYEKLLYPTNSYLYKDLFLGEYVIKNSDYGKPLMIDIKEATEKRNLKNALISLANQYPKIHPAIYVYDYQNNSYVDIRANDVYPAASIIKLPVLVEMFREIEKGKFSIHDKMVLEDYYRASGSGKLQYSQGGITHSLDYLARIMIENSDNSSTNMIMAKIGGMPQMNRAMRQWGLKTTHINNWLPDLDGTNVSTARELAKILYNVDTTEILNYSSKRYIADYLSHVKNNRLLQAGIPSGALLMHKTGDIGFMLGDAGIVKTPSGKKYIVVILAKRPYNHHHGKEFIVNASKLIYNSF